MLCHKVMSLFCTEPFTRELIAKRHNLSSHYKWSHTEAASNPIVTKCALWVSLLDVIDCAQFHLYCANSFNFGWPVPENVVFHWLERWPLQQLELYSERSLLWWCVQAGWKSRLLTPSTPAVSNCCCSKGSAPYWSNPPFLIFDIRALWRSGLSARAPKCQKLKMVG